MLGKRRDAGEALRLVKAGPRAISGRGRAGSRNVSMVGGKLSLQQA